MAPAQVSPKACISHSFRADMRSVVRYALQANATFRWMDAAGNLHEERGKTRDISPRGAFIAASIMPPSGVSLSVTLHLPPQGGSTREIRIEMQGKVLRVQQTGKATFGFAIQNKWMRHAPAA